MATSFHAISPDHPCITIATKKEEREKESKETRRSDTKVFLRSKKRSPFNCVTHERTCTDGDQSSLTSFLLHTNFSLTFSMHHPFPRKRRRHREIEREQCPPSSMRVNDEVEKQKEKIEDRAPGGRLAALCLRERPAF